MATIDPTVAQNGDGSIKNYTYETLTTTNDVGAAIALDQHVDCSIQLLGTLGAGGTLVWEGSNDGGTTWATLDSISLQAAAIVHCQVPAALARPHVTAGDGTTDLDVHVVCRRPNQMRQ